MDENTLEILLKECVITLRVDSDDTAETDYISLLILESADFIKETVSEIVDLMHSPVKELLRNRVRYAYNNAIEDFLYNFSEDIERLQVLYAEITQ